MDTTWTTALSISNRHSGIGLVSGDLSIKSEPMDFETTSPYNNHNSSNARNIEDSLNAFGPQVNTDLKLFSNKIIS
jgi:hypothetical protein